MKNIKGFTMLEVLISLSLLSFVLAETYGIMATGNAIYTKNFSLLEMEQQTRNATDRIVREVRQASSQTITTNYNNTTNDKISFTIPAATGIQYYLNGTNLVLAYPGQPARNIASSIKLLKFTLTGSLLKIQVRADKTIYSTIVSFPLTEKVRLRNE
jgi:prepilin-type N-terminal cleavage/methylation domain-containing protein